MKKIYNLTAVVAFFLLSFCFTNVYAQCSGDHAKCKSGVAIVRADENGNHDVPSSAMTFPEYKGGIKEMCKYIRSTMRFPSNLAGKSGKTMVQFNVSKEGAISDVEVVTSSGFREFDDEAVRIVKSFPNWKPATQNCESVAMKTQVPIIFEQK